MTDGFYGIGRTRKQLIFRTSSRGEDIHPEGFGNLSSAKVRSSVRAMLALLYPNMTLPEIPLSDIPPVKLDRNRELYERYKSGERVADLAREYGISVRRANRLIKPFETKGY